MKKFSYKDVGAAVVFDRPDGGSVSAKIESVAANTIRLRFAVPFNGQTWCLVAKQNWGRITVFPRNSLFLVT